EREKSDLKNIEQPSVKDFLKQQELELSRVKFETAQKVMEIYKQQTDNLLALYDKQDKMLIGIFGSDYASEKENILEGE
ncbi:hypothetical protein ANCDUO_20316, partial [Ancylostoma duodenale]